MKKINKDYHYSNKLVLMSNLNNNLNCDIFTIALPLESEDEDDDKFAECTYNQEGAIRTVYHNDTSFRVAVLNTEIVDRITLPFHTLTMLTGISDESIAHSFLENDHGGFTSNVALITMKKL